MADVDIEELGALGGDEDVRAGRMLQAHVRRISKATRESWNVSAELQGGLGAGGGNEASPASSATDSFVPGMQRIWVKTFGCR